jgi:alanyl-tRNA synthetase
MAERLYYSDAYCTAFDARVVERLTLAGSPAVVLDRTAFYPTSGGQPHDTGTLNGVAVVEVVEREEDHAVVHRLGAPLSGDDVHGAIDWPRRFDHMQQHTGQHILSQACVQTADADTVGFHLSGDYSTIDLNRNLDDDDIARAEALANQIVIRDLPVVARWMTPDQVAALPLRKPPAVLDSIRIIQVGDFDWSACGGTHLARSGEAGLIKITRGERRGSETRITFLCGGRALAHYGLLNTLARDLALRLTVGVEELPQTIDRLQSEARALRKERDQLHEALLDHEAIALAGSAQTIGRVSVVQCVFQARPVDEVRRLAARLVAQPGYVALLGLRGEKAQLIFARAADLSYDMRPLLKEACRLVSGGGGGGLELAQGGGPDAAHLDEAMQHAADELRRQIEQNQGA